MKPAPRERPDPVEWVKGFVLLICGAAWASLLTLLILFAMIVLTSQSARAQENHHLHHSDYQGWRNKLLQGCCNNQDCGVLDESNERTSRGFLEVRIEGVWCPVKSHHYLESGNVPDASTAHVCVWHQSARPDLQTPCERLLCYQPRPLM